MRVRPIDPDLPPSHVKVLDEHVSLSAGGGATHPPVVSASPSARPDHQPRERAVPCRRCPMRIVRGHIEATMTFNHNAVCDGHDVPETGRSRTPAPRPSPGRSVRGGW